MEFPNRQYSLVYTVKGTTIPNLPVKMEGAVKIELFDRGFHDEEEMNFFSDFPIKEWDCWKISGATSGFTGNGMVRLNCDKLGLCLRWLKNSKAIYGIRDYGPIRGNYRLCHKCGKIAGQCNTGAHITEEYFDREKHVSVLEYHCTNCSHAWAVEKTNGRPRPNKHQPANGNGHQKPSYVRRRHEPKRRRNYAFVN